MAAQTQERMAAHAREDELHSLTALLLFSLLSFALGDFNKILRYIQELRVQTSGEVRETKGGKEIT